MNSSLHRTATPPIGAPAKTTPKRWIPLSVPFLPVLLLLTVLLTLACTDPDGSDTTSESGAPDAGTQTSLQSETADGPTPTATPMPVVLGDCRDGMVLQPGEGCRYTGGGSSRPRVLLSAGWDGTICREGGPIQQVLFGADVTVDNFRLCTTGFEIDDSFSSDIVTRRNSDGSWTFYESRLSASEAASSGSQSSLQSDQGVYTLGQNIPNFPTDRASAGSFRNAGVTVQGGNSVITMDNGGSAEYSHATYTCVASSSCRIENGRVVAGSVLVTGTTDTSSAPTSGAIPAMRLTDNDDFDLAPAWSPDGRRIAFASDRDGDLDIYVMNGDGSNLTRLTDNDHPDFAPAWSPDGRRVAFASARDGDWDIYVTNGNGSDLARGVDAARLTDNDDQESSPAWSPDGRRIAFVSDRDGVQDIYVMDADGSNVTRLTDNDDLDLEPDWSPDGRRIAFVSDRDGVQNIYVMDADGSNVTRLTDSNASDFGPAWSPDGRRIAFSSDRDGDWDIYVMDPDGSNVTRLTTDNHSDDGSPAWSPDGRRIAFVSDRGGDFDIYVMSADGEPTSTLTPAPTVAPTYTSMSVMRLTNNDHSDFGPAWSPDGRRIAFYSDRDGDHDIYVMDADGSNVTRLTDNNYDDRAPAWSPDGRRIAFYIYRLGKSDVYAMDADGSNVTPLTNNDVSDISPAWSPDGRRITFGLSDIRDWNIYVMDADGSNVTRLTDSRSDENDRSAWSPDGRRIAFAAGRSGNLFGWDYEIYVMDADGSNVTNLTDNGGQDFDPAWSPDGRRIAFASDRDGDRDIYVMDADGSNVVRLTDNDSDDGGPAWSPDGRRIAFASDRDGDWDIYVMDADGSTAVVDSAAETATPAPAPTVAPPPTSIPANRPPRFTNEATFTVSEDERYPSLRLTAVDPDETDSVTGYAITGGADRAKFSIDRRNDLELDAGTDPFVGTDYENPTDADRDNVYEVIVTVTSGSGARELSTAITITAVVTNTIEVPNRVNEPNVEFTTETSVRVTWTRPFSRGVNTIGYDVRYRRQNTATWNVWPHSGTTLSATLTGLTTNADYDVQVRAQSPEGAGEWSPSAWATAAIHDPPSEPGNVRWAQVGSSERVRISWGAAANATYYKLYACTSIVQQVACTLRQVASRIDATEYVHTISGSSFGTTYVRFAVSACNGTGCSESVDAQ